MWRRTQHVGRGHQREPGKGRLEEVQDEGRLDGGEPGELHARLGS